LTADGCPSPSQESKSQEAES